MDDEAMYVQHNQFILESQIFPILQDQNSLRYMVVHERGENFYLIAIFSLLKLFRSWASFWEIASAIIESFHDFEMTMVKIIVFIQYILLF